MEATKPKDLLPEKPRETASEKSSRTKTAAPNELQINEMIEALRESADLNPSPMNIRMCEQEIAALRRRQPAALARLARNLQEQDPKEKVGA